MMKIFTIIFFSSIVCESFAQIPNGDFESWTNGAPDECFTTNLPYLPAAISQDSDAYAGFFAVKGMVVSNNNHPYPPSIFLNGGSAVGFPVSKAFGTLNGYVKLNLQQGDRFRGTIHLYNVNYESIADGQIVIDSSISSWTEFSVYINYLNADVPVYCGIDFTLTDNTLTSSARIGSYFVLDMLTLNGTAGIEENNVTGNFTLYPNPATDYISFSDHTLFQHGHYFISDLSGKQIISGDIVSDKLATSALLPGVYFLNLSGDKKSVTKKFIVQ